MPKNEDGLDHIRIPFEKIKFGNKLEVQGYGTIYEGEFEDQKAALKRLNITNLTNIKHKLLDEILTISEFRHHPNLVALLGFCDEKSNEIILVYEYVSGGNLADKMRTRLNTIQRLEICLGAARGLEYLHNGVDATKTGIVHGNIKPSKILLNFNNSKFEAKVSSFGLSKIVPGQASIKSIEDIEKVTKESDVYDFGVLLLEVLCGVSELVDTDDYQERHVTELVPKRLEQDKVRKIVHFDIRKEIKTEALEVYAKIACQCVMESVEARPTMGQVVEELEKALRLQGGEITYVQIIGNKNIADSSEEIVVDDGPNESVTMDSNVDLNNPIIEEDVIGLIAGDKLDVAGEDNGDEIKIVDETSDSINGEKNTIEDITKESTIDNPETPEEIIDDSNSNEKSYIVDKNEDEDDNQNRTHIEDVQKDSTNNEPETTEDFIDDLNLNEKSNTTQTEDAREESSNDEPETIEDVTDDSNSKIGCKNEDDNQNITLIEDAHTIDEITDDSNQKSNFSGETKDDNQSINIVTVSESSNIDISTSDHSTNQEVQNIAILETDSREVNNLPDENYNTKNVDELEHLQIPFEKIKFGKKIDVHGYGSTFEGEFEDKKVALKRLNITNLDNIKPKLFQEILTISKFRDHPNVVSLIGFCDEKTNEIILVYEYVSSGNLADKISKHLTTIQRLEICLGSARGLEYLHTGIIHGDIKLSKILLNSDLSKYEAKVSGYGLSKLLPGDVQIGRNSTRESDVYFFGVLLLEVLCGVSELVDTDDYQERHVSELVPKILEQNMLRKIVQFDIRNEIKTECLKIYVKIACRCVMKESEDRPTMAEVVKELEKALRLQDVKDNYEKMSLDVAEEEPELKNENIEKTVDDFATIEQSSVIRILGGKDFDNVPEITQISDAEKENDENTEEITVDLKSNEESKINGEKEIDQESKIVTSSESNDATKELGNNDHDRKKIIDNKITATEIQDSDNMKAEKDNTLLKTGKKPEMIVNAREGNLLFVEKNQESESKRSNSTCSESSNGDSTTPSDYLLPKSPANGTIVKKSSDGSRNCCWCSWWRYISDRVVFYGGQFWNKLVACFTWVRGQCSRKND